MSNDKVQISNEIQSSNTNKLINKREFLAFKTFVIDLTFGFLKEGDYNETYLKIKCQ